MENFRYKRFVAHRIEVARYEDEIVNHQAHNRCVKELFLKLQTNWNFPGLPKKNQSYVRRFYATI